MWRQFSNATQQAGSDTQAYATNENEENPNLNPKCVHTHTHTHIRIHGLKKGVSENEALGPVGAYASTALRRRSARRGEQSVTYDPRWGREVVSANFTRLSLGIIEANFQK